MRVRPGGKREIALRVSMGATPEAASARRTPSPCVCSYRSSGGALGLAIAWGLILIAPKIVPPEAIPGGVFELSMPAIWFALAISLFSSLLFGLAPALVVARSDIQAALKNSSRSSTAGGKSQRFRQVLIVAEAAVALMLLAGAGLMIESLRDLTLATLVSSGDPQHVVTRPPAAAFR